jgi:hypothetical protein
VGALNSSESAIADATIMTPGVTGGYEEVLVLRVRRGGRYKYFVCFAAFGALHFKRSGKPRALPGVIVVSPLRGEHF